MRGGDSRAKDGVMSNEDPQAAIARLSVLTPAEQAVLDEALTGIPAREIAEHLSLSEATVRSHLSSIYVKLGVSGRVALLAQFRGPDHPVLAEPTQPPRPRSVSITGVSWGVVAVLEAAYAIYLLSGALANGGTQEVWILAIGFGILAALVARLARDIRDRPSRGILRVSLAAAVGHLLFAVRGLYLGQPVQPFLVLGALAVVMGVVSLWALRDFPG
jgi:DNA-binding CsgD family transcriptional regulator